MMFGCGKGAPHLDEDHSAKCDPEPNYFANSYRSGENMFFFEGVYVLLGGGDYRILIDWASLGQRPST